MKKKFRIKEKFYKSADNTPCVSELGYKVQMSIWPGIWITVLNFCYNGDISRSKREAVWLFEYLTSIQLR